VPKKNGGRIPATVLFPDLSVNASDVQAIKIAGVMALSQL